MWAFSRSMRLGWGGWGPAVGQPWGDPMAAAGPTCNWQPESAARPSPHSHSGRLHRLGDLTLALRVGCQSMRLCIACDLLTGLDYRGSALPCELPITIAAADDPSAESMAALKLASGADRWLWPRISVEYRLVGQGEWR